MTAGFELHLPSWDKHQALNQFCISAWYTTTYKIHTHPTGISPSKHWIFNASSINLDSNFTPRALLVLSWAPCFPLQAVLHTACRLLLIIDPAQRTLIQSDQKKWPPTKWLWGASVTGCLSWDHWSLQNCPVESILKSSTTGNAGTARQWYIVGKLHQTD